MGVFQLERRVGDALSQIGQRMGRLALLVHEAASRQQRFNRAVQRLDSGSRLVWHLHQGRRIHAKGGWHKLDGILRLERTDCVADVAIAAQTQLDGPQAETAGDRIREVMAEVPLVKADAGHPPLVTPSSQIVGTQAVFNVLMGKYKVLTGEFADLMLGYYGECLGERNPEVVEIARAQAKKEPITGRPADLLSPEWEHLVAEASALEGFDGSSEDVLTHALFPSVAPGFFKSRPDGPKSVGKTPEQMANQATAKGDADRAVKGPITYKVSLGGREHSVVVERA